MSDNSAIAWTDATWNPVRGCSKVSAGCQLCYAETLDRRFRLSQEGQPFAPWTHPNAAYNVRLLPEMLPVPVHWKRPRMVFVNSRSDFFHDAIPAEFRERMWAVMKQATQHTFQILTKRPENIERMLPSDWGGGYPNVWLGTSVEHQAHDRRIRELLCIPAALRFLSAEPLLGQLALGRPEQVGSWADDVDWVIIGGESGAGCRPMDPDWARELRDYAVGLGIPFFFKQWGGHPDKRAHDSAVLDGRTWTEIPARLPTPKRVY